MAHVGTGFDQLLVVAVLVVGGAYGCGVLRLLHRGDRWVGSSWTCFIGGVACLVATMAVPPLARPATFAEHIVAHLVLVMPAPMLLALGAPVTLALRLSSPRVRRRLLLVLHSRVLRYAMWPPVLLGLQISGMYAFYLSPLFSAAERHPLLHLVLHFHMFVCGALLSWYLVGRDPDGPPEGTGRGLLVLTTAAGAHDVLAILMY